MMVRPIIFVVKVVNSHSKKTLNGSSNNLLFFHNNIVFILENIVRISKNI
jgi:hypothetical protein